MRALLASAVLLSATAASGQVVLSGSFGRAMTVGGMTDARETWPATAADAGKLVRDFRATCLSAAAPAAIPAGYEQHDVALPAEGKAAATTVRVLAAPGVRIATWSGDPLGLKSRASLIRDRGVVITGPVGDRDIFSGQCSLSAHLTGLTGEAISQAMTAAFGTPVKIVVKPGFADGEWAATRPDGSALSIRFSANDLKKPEQVLHISSLPVRVTK